MKITNIRTVDVCVPLSTHGVFEPVRMWYGTRSAALKTIIFLDTDEGITGLGEAWASASHTIEGLKRFLIGSDPFDVNSIDRQIGVFGNVLTTVGHLHPGQVSVIGAIDIALWDIIGKVTGQPIYKLIGGKFRDRVEARYWMCTKDPDGVADEVREAVKRGFRSFKIKIGINPEQDVECVKAAREAAGSGI